jgi:hypothetical protein
MYVIKYGIVCLPCIDGMVMVELWVYTLFEKCGMLLASIVLTSMSYGIENKIVNKTYVQVNKILERV